MYHVTCAQLHVALVLPPCARSTDRAAATDARLLCLAPRRGRAAPTPLRRILVAPAVNPIKERARCIVILVPRLAAAELLAGLRIWIVVALRREELVTAAATAPTASVLTHLEQTRDHLLARTPPVLAVLVASLVRARCFGIIVRKCEADP